MQSALIIPTFNEGERVLAVVNAAKGCESVGDIIVVNDGSSDETAELLAFQEGLTVQTHRRNKGKGEALDTGMHLAEDLGYEQVVFLDADLQGIEPQHIDKLLAPLNNNEAMMVIGYLGLRKAVIKKFLLSQWGGLSGQRALTMEAWDLLNNLDKHGFNVEAALNSRMRKRNLHHLIARVALDGVGHIGKHEKTGSWPQAIWGYTKTYSSAMRTYARIGLE